MKNSPALHQQTRALCRASLSIFLAITLGCNKQPFTSASHDTQQPFQNNAKSVSDIPHIQSLIDRVKPGPRTAEEFDARIDAINELGRQQVVEAVPALVEGIDKIHPLFTENAAEFSGNYPCAIALVAIGEPAVPQIQKRFEATQSGPERLALLNTIVRIKGKASVIRYLKQVARSGGSATSKTELVELQSYVECMGGPDIQE